MDAYVLYFLIIFLLTMCKMAFKLIPLSNSSIQLMLRFSSHLSFMISLAFPVIRIALHPPQSQLQKMIMNKAKSKDFLKLYYSRECFSLGKAKNYGQGIFSNLFHRIGSLKRWVSFRSLKFKILSVGFGVKISISRSHMI